MSRSPDPLLEVQVIRSAKRKKSSQARLRGEVLEVRIPSWFSEHQEHETVAHFVGRFERSRSASTIDLTDRARHLAATLDLPEAKQIRWVSNQRDRWGSCTPAHGTIRLSDRLAAFPPWVVDYVIVHELTHLLEPHHGERFWEIVGRYELAERARGYLMAKGHDGH
jgi:predicted metal-dependent hydrolase